ncbi:MAG: hypothetical protein KGH65_04060 [Candidatus Micrarchaeota archaeon]|nr:hypothetical protein [Candidatus Micrarchaeota archaeon]
MEMKNGFGMVAAFAAVGMMLVLMGTVSANGELSVTNLAITPQPVLAGQNFTVSFQLYNSYGSLQNVNLGLSGTYPLFNYSPIDTQLITSVSPGLYGGIGYFFRYHLSVPKNVQSGTYTLYVTASYQISATSSGGSTNLAASSNIPITFYISGAPSITLTANPVTTVVPGSQSTIDISAFNSGTASATNVNITVLDGSNFTVSGTPTFNLGTVGGGASASAAATLQANSTMTPGQNYIPVRLKYSTQYGSNVTTIVNVPISVIINAPNLIPSIVSSAPQTLYAGSNQTLSVSIQNIGLGVAKNVTVSFIGTQNITVGSSASSIFIGTMQPGASQTQAVFISASKYDNKTHYQIPVELSYSNANYQTKVQKTLYLNVTLQNSAIYNVTSVSGTLLPGATYVPLTFRIKNIGGQTAQQVTFSLQSIYPIVPASPNQYLAQLAPGQSANVTFYVNVDAQGNGGSYPVTVYEQWSQPNGATSQQYSSSQNYYAVVGLTNPSGGSSGGSGLYIIGGIVVIVAMAVVLRKRIPPLDNFITKITAKRVPAKKEKGNK